MRSFFNGDLSKSEGNVNVGLTFANNPSFCLILSSPCSGRTFADGSLSNLGWPMAPNRIASASKQT